MVRTLSGLHPNWTSCLADLANVAVVIAPDEPGNRAGIDQFKFRVHDDPFTETTRRAATSGSESFTKTA